MNAPHLIRLRGPWQRTVVFGAETVIEGGENEKVIMPISVADDLGDSFRGRVEYQRFFNRPTGIEASTKLHLALDRVVGADLEVKLNNELLGEFDHQNDRVCFEIGSRLQKRNDLRVRLSTLPSDVESSSTKQVSGLVGEVRLEIG